MNYTSLPAGYVLCRICGMNSHKEQYDQCFNCLKSVNPELYIAKVRNFRASTKEGHEAGGVDGGAKAQTAPERAALLKTPWRKNMTYEELQQKLNDLRAEWRTAGPGLRKLIEVRAKYLKKRYEEEQLQETEKEYDAYEEMQKILRENA